ncbi:MAG: 30S ribosomal protein S20 [Chlamydiales bacterium]
MAEEKKAKTKRPTALKRDMQNQKKRMRNKSFKSQVRTTMNAYNEALKSQEKLALEKSINTLYSMMDKGVKRGIFSINKASRTKARVTKKAAL